MSYPTQQQLQRENNNIEDIYCYNEVVDEDMDVVKESSGMGERSSFEALYVYDNMFGTAPPSTAPPSLDYDDASNCAGGCGASSGSASAGALGASMTTSMLLMAKASQMTPPKSVESVAAVATPMMTASSSNSMVTNAATLSATTTATSAAHVPPASYDDLNNIFEEESSADEQQQPVQQMPSHNQHIWGVCLFKLIILELYIYIYKHFSS